MDEMDEQTSRYLNESITVEEIIKGLAKLKCYKTAEFDNISPEVTKSQCLRSTYQFYSIVVSLMV